MSLWKTNSNDDDSTDPDDDTLNYNSELAISFSSPLSTRETEKALRRETNSPFLTPHRNTLTISLNRLNSIYHDSKFIQKLSLQYPNLPLVGTFPPPPAPLYWQSRLIISKRTLWTMVYSFLPLSFLSIF